MAKVKGKTLGRLKRLSELKRNEVISQLREGKAVAAIARNFHTSRQTIMRVRDATNN